MPRLYPRYLLIAAFCLLAGALHAQRGVMDDVVYLQNGDTLRGSIIEMEPCDYLILEMIGGSKLRIAQDSVIRVLRQPSRYTSIGYQALRPAKPVVMRERGWQHQISLLFLSHSGTWGPRLDPGIQYRLGYRWQPRLATGVGIGLEAYESGGIMPIYAEATGDFFRKRLTPCYLVQAGYGFSVIRAWNVVESRGGLHYQAGLGLKYHTRSRSEWILSVGYKQQHSSESVEEWWWDWQGNSTVNRIDRTRVYRGLVWQLTMSL
ncbi:MAG: hypothetical protein OHK0039_41190 [Bacteroidia bacterium]